MKSKELLLGEYREMTENNALQKDVAFLEVLIDIRDALLAIVKLLQQQQDRSQP